MLVEYLTSNDRVRIEYSEDRRHKRLGNNALNLSGVVVGRARPISVTKGGVQNTLQLNAAQDAALLRQVASPKRDGTKKGI